jgi:hypothetical protein
MEAIPQFDTNSSPTHVEKDFRFDIQVPLRSVRKISMPFDLRQDPSKYFEPENEKLLFDVFPKTQAIEFDNRVLVYRFDDELPPMPWPQEIAGVPCYLTNDPHDNGPLIPIRYQSR